MIICGYCESQNQNNNQCCIACGGSLVDEISRKRNTKIVVFSGMSVRQYRMAVDLFGKEQAQKIFIKKVQHPGLPAKEACEVKWQFA